MIRKSIPWIVIAALVAALCYIGLQFSIRPQKTALYIKVCREELRFMENRSDSACENGVTELVKILSELRRPISTSSKEPDWIEMSAVMEHERKRLLKQVIGCLRKQTGKDLGDDPDVWTNQFGSHK